MSKCSSVVSTCNIYFGKRHQGSINLNHDTRHPNCCLPSALMTTKPPPLARTHFHIEILVYNCILIHRSKSRKRASPSRQSSKSATRDSIEDNLQALESSSLENTPTKAMPEESRGKIRKTRYNLPEHLFNVP